MIKLRMLPAETIEFDGHVLNDGHLWVFNVGAGAIPDALEEDHHGQAKAGLMVCHKLAVFIKFSNFLRKFHTYSILF